ncbi:MAG: hypothetical protein AAF490_05685 [Chloroflexota bacterium]
MNQQKFSMKFLWLTAVTMFMIIGCRQADSEEGAGFISFQQQSTGISFDYPEDWVQKELTREILLASSQTSLDENQFHEAAGLVIFMEEQSVVGPDLEYFMRKYVIQDEMRYLTAIRPDKLEINGREAVGVKFSRPQGDLDAIIGVLLIQLEEDEGVIFVQYVLDSTSEDELLPQIDRIIESIDVSS